MLNKTTRMTPNLQHILSTTEQLIQEKGCTKTTLQDIIQRSGLSKGAIYHYVKSKDELFGLILQIRMEKIDEDFLREKQKENAGLDGPLQAIADGMKYLTNETDVANKIFIYLLGKKEEPVIADILERLYERSIHQSMLWIEAGQRAGVIKPSLDLKQTSKMFITHAYGLRVRAVIEPADMTSAIQEFHHFMRHTLHIS